ncbi:hypothetical protein CROQUDRAFT_655231 [Cronartium quercuum f. sp. fusiforme G11]|uniref:enoyl-[acyl-carrier-protein] reductase n=1 Tax=Cronartium quercuum f. sp. fusiforme G11 TaxID=708437 RepID=A0A9P6TDV7_9BASI|nr:hypothetical protein CROQUDRAFT_655231 [Cronartium quercuum f. sp. fusiforme G11]
MIERSIQYRSVPLLHPGRARQQVSDASRCGRRLRLYHVSQPTRTVVKAITYTQNGDPTEVLRYTSYTLPDPLPNELRLRMRLSPLNPADINTIQGRYPFKPKPRTDLMGLENQSPVYIPGNEGLGVVEQLGSGVDPGLWQVGDWVITGKPQLGTWQSHANLNVEDVIKLQRSKQLTDIQAATMAVNLATGFRLIKDSYHFGEPHFKDGWIIQNGANSSVGQFVIQLCKAWDIGCIGLIRDRPDIETVRNDLIKLGPINKTKILTYKELESDTALRSQLKSLNICLGFNCVSGSTTSELMKFLRPNSSLITYGGMSMKPIPVPTSLLIFKNLQLKGFMLTQSLAKQPLVTKANLISDLLKLIETGQISAQTNAQIVKVESVETVRDIIGKAMAGNSGKKYLFQF